MSKSPGTVSKILWHFTGGPEWDSELHKQKKVLKKNSSSFEILNKIIDGGVLKTGSFSEVAQTLSMNGDDDVLNTIQTRPVCCLADIPIQHLGYHSKRYGKIAIGFHRSAIMRAFHPVLYNPIGSYLNLEIGMLNDWMRDNSAVILEQVLKNKGMLDNFENAEVFGLIDSIKTNVEICTSLFVDILTYSKSFEPTKEFETIYCEREWRATDDFHFTHDDIAMVLLPRRGGFYNRFLEKSTDFERKFSVVAWEDLIEH